MKKIIPIIVAAHGHFATALVDSCRMLMGELENVYAVDFKEQDTIEQFGQKLDVLLHGIDTSEGVLALVDILGGTPFNQLMLRSKQGFKLIIFSGINIPTTIEIFLSRNANPTCKDLADSAIQNAKNSFSLSSQLVDDTEMI